MYILYTLEASTVLGADLCYSDLSKYPKCIVRYAVSYLSSLCSLSSNSWILFSSSVIPAVGRGCPSMSATRDFNSFTWEWSGTVR